MQAAVIDCSRDVQGADAPGCDFQGKFPCLPGIGEVGIGFDAVKGDSFGVARPVYKLATCPHETM